MQKGIHTCRSASTGVEMTVADLPQTPPPAAATEMVLQGRPLATSPGSLLSGEPSGLIHCCPAPSSQLWQTLQMTFAPAVWPAVPG